MLKNKRGQATLEYFLVVVAVVAALLIFLGPNGAFGRKFTNTMDQVSNGVTDMGNRLSGSRPLAP